MTKTLRVTVGQYSDKGLKPANQDFHGVSIPDEPQRSAKGIAIALADGISSSDVSHVASAAAVRGFLEDYYCTSDAWSVKTAGQRVLFAINSWLNAQTRQSRYREDRNRGYVCTFSGMVLKSATAHLFHIGDTRICRLSGNSLEQLTNDHRVVLSSAESYLGRAMGADPHVDIDYQAIGLSTGDVFVLATDGVYEHVDARFVADSLRTHATDLDAAARAIGEEALRRGSQDNLTVQLLRVDSVPVAQVSEMQQQVSALPLPPLPEPRALFDGYRIIRSVHASSRSHIYLAEDEESGARVIIKLPSVDLRGDPAYLERFMMEEWVARRINDPHVLQGCPRKRRQNYLYVVTEYIEGQTLAQWMTDNPRPDLETVRSLVEQIARGLQAFHRQEMLHQDLRPQNIMIDRSGTVKIIDFGSTRVAGMLESGGPVDATSILGTTQYTAPEYFLGEGGTPASDLFSLGVIAYQMLTGRLPYGAEVARTRTRKEQARLQYRSLVADDLPIPAWVDEALRKAVQVDPTKRYGLLSEFLFDLRQPNPQFFNRRAEPLLARNPLLFWKGLSVALGLIVVYLIWLLNTRH
ncbi:MAG: bifunctional protein-serine/threonine kinase/phosphatase [Rhodocyclaceae bacterium]|nr:bifunctional protein-serine/threonine kinase/phosphatase [Rhodocyclaceae bacterium]MBX3669672.1 bifunctional protein-serine/threonine kinase/phosphatase [Rhodocyclaceae bacterium]